jgi:hypothetical protein
MYAAEERKRYAVPCWHTIPGKTRIKIIYMATIWTLQVFECVTDKIPKNPLNVY